jgi:hypothetical protein
MNSIKLAIVLILCTSLTLSQTTTNNVNLPPTTPTLDPSLSSTNPTFTKLKNLLSYLPPFMQQQLGACMASNTDTNRLFDPDCYIGKSAQVVKGMGQGFGSYLTDNSKQTRNGLGCLSKATVSWGNSTDVSSNVISTDLSTIVALQTTRNACEAKWTKFIIEFTSARSRFLLTTIDNINSAAVTVSNGDIVGFPATYEEMTSAISNFKEFSKCIYEFNNKMATKVLDIQTSIGQLPNCKNGGMLPPPNNGTIPPQNGTMPPPLPPNNSTRLLQTSPQGQNGQQPPQGQNGQQPPQGQNGQQPPQGQNGQQPPQGQNGQRPMEPPQLKSNNSPQNTGRQDFKGQLDNQGRPANIPMTDDLKNLITSALNDINNKNLAQWKTLSSKISTSTTATSGYRIQPAVHRFVLDRMSDSQKYKDEFSKAIKGVECADDYLFFCTSGSCSCQDTGCPSTISGTTSITINDKPTFQVSTDNTYNGVTIDPTKLATTNMTPNMPVQQLMQIIVSQQQQTSTPVNGQNQPAGQPPQGSQQGAPTGLQSGQVQQQAGIQNQQGGPQLPNLQLGNQQNKLNSYYICTFCLNKKRYIYSESNSSLGGNVFDFSNKDVKAGDGLANQNNACANALTKDNSDDKKKCRGDFNPDCAAKLDGTCKNSGLYNVLLKNPTLQNPYPPQCDDAQSGYSEQTCFNWVMNKFTIGTIVPSPAGIMGAGVNIANANASPTSSRLRLLQDTSYSYPIKDDVTASDPKATAVVSTTKLSDSSVSVDSATSTSVPNAALYINDLNTVVANTPISSGYIGFSVILAILVLIL